MRKGKHVAVPVDAEMWAWLARMAEDNDASVAEIVRGCIRDARAIDRGEYVRSTPALYAERSHRQPTPDQEGA